jgi:hypothetical protein
MPIDERVLCHTQSLIKRAIELVRESEDLVQDTKATRMRLNRSRRLCRESASQPEGEKRPLRAAMNTL